MINKKATKKYYFSVEGETEHWYLKWLQEIKRTLLKCNNLEIESNSKAREFCKHKKFHSPWDTITNRSDTLCAI